MARYIDADKIEYHFCSVYQDKDKHGFRGYVWGNMAYKNDINLIPTADVVPKSEVEKIFEEIENIITNQCLVLKDEQGIEGYVKASVHYALSELKKKYTESEGE